MFVPACEDGTYPFFRASEASEIDEERCFVFSLPLSLSNSSRAEGVGELTRDWAMSRRLLYVAITRAQGFCFLSHANARMAGCAFSRSWSPLPPCAYSLTPRRAAEMKQKKLSPFLQTASTTYPTLFVKKLQKVTQKTREEMSKVLGRPAPNEETAKRMIDE